MSYQAARNACLIPRQQLSVLAEECKNGNGTAKNNQAGPDENPETATDGHMV
jgi:hypothetical protein